MTALLSLPAEILATHGSGQLTVTYHECKTGDCCPTGTATCGGAVCIDLQTDPLNCGGCGNVCPSGQVCQGGGCTPPPPPPSGSTVKGSCDTDSSAGSGCVEFVGSSFTPDSAKALCVVAPDGPPGATATWSSGSCKSGFGYGCCLTTDGTSPGTEVFYCPYALSIDPSDWIALCTNGSWIAN